MTKIPTLTTTRLTLRPFTDQDVDPLHQILSVPGVLRYFPKTAPPSRDQVQRLVDGQLQHWAEHGLGWWAVEPRRGRELIGWCGLQFLPETEETEVAYLLAKPHWGRGLATEGARASLHFGFETLRLETIIALVHPDNIASQRVIQKLKMPFVNRALYFGIDVYRYILERADYDPESTTER